MNDYEGNDRRLSYYSNIQHPFYLKPEFLLMGIAGLITTAVVVTLWVTTALGDVNMKVTSNIGEIAHIKEVQIERSVEVKEEIAEIKESQKEMKSDMKEGFKDIGSKLDKIIDRELNRNGNR